MYDWDVAYRSSSLQQTLGGIYFGGAMLVVPLCAALPAGLAQVEELQTNFIDYRIIRSSMPRYEVTKLASAFLASGAAIALAFVFHALIWNILATPCNPLEMIISLYLLRMIASSRRGKRYFTACPSIFGLQPLCFSAAAYGAWRV